jgi:hypothetical protein
MGRTSRRVIGLLAGVGAIAAGTHQAAAETPKVLQLAEGKGGFKIEQGGAGNEQPTVTTLARDGKQYVVTIFMSSDVQFWEIPWQCKCTSVELSATGEPKVVADRVQLTSLFGDRPCNHPKADTDGEHVVWTFGSNHPDQQNVSTYAGVVDHMCQEVSNPIRISNNYNANEGAPDIVYNGNGTFTAGYLSQGSQDISYARLLTKSGGSLQKGFLKSVVTPANIGRPTIVPLGNDRSLFCAAKGDFRPPEDGVSCALLDLNTGEKVWQDLVAPSNPYSKVYMNQPQLAKMGDRVALQVIESDGLGKKKNKKGSSKTHLLVLRPDDAGPNMEASKESLGPYQAHASICAGRYGLDGTPRVGIFDASITGSGLATISFAHYDSAAKSLSLDKQKDEWVVGAYNGDSGFIANIYGNNPNTQGRDFLRCLGDVPNPGAGVEGGFMPNVTSFFAVPYTGRKPDEGKNALFLSLVPGHTTKAVQPEPPDEDDIDMTTGVGATSGGATSGGDGDDGGDSADVPGTGFGAPDEVRHGGCGCGVPGSGTAGGAAAALALAALGIARSVRQRKGR